MESAGRKITKIARELNKLVVKTMKEDGMGTAEIDFIHMVRHNPGITQAQIRENLKIDKGAAARRAANLEAKGYLTRKENPADGRSRLLYATPKAETLKNSKVSVESVFYDWLLSGVSPEEREAFCAVLDKLYIRSKKESRAGFPEVSRLIGEGEGSGAVQEESESDFPEQENEQENKGNEAKEDE